MKIKNIFNTVFLKIWFLLFALIPAIHVLGEDLIDGPNYKGGVNPVNFWYHNDAAKGIDTRGYDIYPIKEYTEDNPPQLKTRFYGYFPKVAANIDGKDYYVLSSTEKTVLINNQKFNTYVFEKGDGIGFKLDKNTDYRIKIFYINENYNSNLLYKVQDITKTGNENAVEASSSISIKNGDGVPSGTCLITYDVTTGGSSEFYWVKNNIDAKLYIGGIEIIKKLNDKTNPKIDKEFTGYSWFVDDNTRNVDNYFGGTQISLASGGGNVFLCDYADGLALNGVSYEISSGLGTHKSVMLNEGSRIGVWLPANKTLKFKYISDKGVKVKFLDESSAQVGKVYENPNDGLSGTVEYSTGTSPEKIWITGDGPEYLYFSGFIVEDKSHNFADADPISSDYVWYPVYNKSFPANTFTDNTGNYTFNAGAEIGANGEEIKINYQTHQTYKFKGENIIGFKVAGGKSGVINFFGAGWGMRIYSTLEDAKAKTNALNLSTYSIDGVQVSPWFFSGDGEKQFWLSTGNNTEGGQYATDQFGGFEVLFESPSVIDLAKGKFDCGSMKDLIVNAIGTDGYNAVAAKKAGVYGPTMMCYPIPNNTVMIGSRQNASDQNPNPSIRNAIVFKVSDDSYNAVKINCNLRDGATIKVYKGNESEPDRNQLCQEFNETGAQTMILDISKDNANQIYWVICDRMAGAHVQSIFVDKVYTSLQTINTDYIYKVADVPAAGIVTNTEGHIKVAGTPEAGAQMTVLGTKSPSLKLDDGEDYIGFKVGTSTAGKTTGRIKVYFNGGNSSSHKMVELPLNVALNSGWNSSYNPDTKTITIGEGGGGRGWWFGTGADARDLSAYNKINIELDVVSGSLDGLQVVVQDANGASAIFEYANGRLLGNLTDTSKQHDSKDGQKFDITKISQIYVQSNSEGSVKIKSARLMTKPVEVLMGTDEDSPASSVEVFGGKIHDVQDAYVYEMPFEIVNGQEQLYWITGDINVGAVEVIYDDVQHAKVIEWYVNKSTKLIVGSDDPKWVFSGISNSGEIPYPGGYDEYATFYVPAGRPASVSFIMPEAVAEVYDWEQAIKVAKANGVASDDEVFDESNNTDNQYAKAVINSYGRHTIVTEEKDNAKKLGVSTGTMTYDRDKGQNAKMGTAKAKLYNWYTYTLDIPSNGKIVNDDYYYAVSITGTQKKDGSDETDKVGVDGLEGKWEIYMRFVFYKSPECKNSNNTVTIAEGHQGAGTIFYTTDSSDPENLDTGIDESRSFTNKYNSGGFSVAGKNCIVKAAQYFNTPYQFYTDCSLGEDSPVSNSLMLVSADLAITNQKDNVVYVQDEDPNDGKEQIFNKQDGGYILTIPTGDKTTVNGKFDQKYNANPYMYLTLGGKDHPYLAGTSFRMCGTNWQACHDGGLKTFLDSYQNKFDVADAKNPEGWVDGQSKQNQNPYTEVNGGVGGSDTEDGGMFLQPIGGTMLRFEPEYDGVITVWLRQNGALDNNTQELGTFTRRPTYVVDENGRIMRRSTIRPNDEHHLGINGVWAINSSVCEERSQVEHTWLYGVAKQVFQNNPLYADRFGANFPNRWEQTDDDGYFTYMSNRETNNDYRGGSIMYGWWYKGFNLNATRSTITSASHLSRFEFMEPELLYRSDKIFDMEMNTLGLKNGFAKYGFELPNFQYVRYRIPVKAGKTYYIAGRGTKNGFAAVSFDPVKANTNGSVEETAALRYADNPEVVENRDAKSERYLKPESNWNRVGNSSGNASETEMINSYNSLATVDIYENGNNYESNIKPQIKNDMDNLGNLVGQTVNVTLHRTFTAGNWYPIILPFSVSETRLEQYFGEGTKVLYLDPYKHTLHNKTDDETNKSFASVLNPALENSKLYFTYHRYQMLYANTPAFICPTFEWSDAKKAPATNNVHPIVTNGEVKEISFKRVTIDGSNKQNDLGGGYFGYEISNDYEVVGSYDQHEESGDLYYVTNTVNPKEEKVAQLIHSKGDNGEKVNMRATRVWIRPKSSAVKPAPIRTVAAKDFSELDFDYGNDEAGISDIVMDDITVERYANDNGVYDLLGRKIGEGSLEGVPSGVYIFQGKKVYIN